MAVSYWIVLIFWLSGQAALAVSCKIHFEQSYVTGFDPSKFSVASWGRSEDLPYYKTLGVTQTASQYDIQMAYRVLARQYHPDLNQHPEAEARFKDIGEAYSILRDPHARAYYDQYGERP